MGDPFEQKKQHILNGLNLTNEGSPDTSPKGSIDLKCLPIINLINSKKNMVTTSSCSGRVSVYLQGRKLQSLGTFSEGSKGNEGHWLFITHDPENVSNWSRNLKFMQVNQNSIRDVSISDSRHILYKFEPFILHVKCKSLDTAGSLYTAAMNTGFRESGIGTNFNVAIRTSIRLDVPIGYYDPLEETIWLYVSEEYLAFLDKLSVEKFRENFTKIDLLYKAIELLDDADSLPDTRETKEQRRERKRREGLAKRDELHFQKASTLGQ